MIDDEIKEWLLNMVVEHGDRSFPYRWAKSPWAAARKIGRVEVIDILLPTDKLTCRITPAGLEYLKNA